MHHFFRIKYRSQNSQEGNVVSIFLEIPPLLWHNSFALRPAACYSFPVLLTAFSVLYVALILPLHRWLWICRYLQFQITWGCSYNKGTAYSVSCTYCPCSFFAERRKVDRNRCKSLNPITVLYCKIHSSWSFCCLYTIFSAIRFVLFLEK